MPEQRTLGYDPERGIIGLEPETWAMELGFLFDRLWSSAVGRAVITSVRRRTTIYPSQGGAQTDADPYDDVAGVPFPDARRQAVAREAATTGANAMMWFDIHARTRRARGAMQSTPVASLLHELVHAVNITWGNFQVRTSFSAEETERFGVASPEEEIAWIIDNMHRSERGLWLRRRYIGDAMLPPGSVPTPGATGTELSTSEARAVNRLRWRVAMLASALERIDARACPYNPFREYARRSPVSRP